jgi:hypothetical protein
MKKRKTKVLSFPFPTEAELAETMRRQILSWPSRVNVDEVGITLLVGLCQILINAYGDCDRLPRLSQIAKVRLGFEDGDGPNHKIMTKPESLRLLRVEWSVTIEMAAQVVADFAKASLNGGRFRISHLL